MRPAGSGARYHPSKGVRIPLGTPNLNCYSPHGVTSRTQHSRVHCVRPRHGRVIRVGSRRGEAGARVAERREPADVAILGRAAVLGRAEPLAHGIEAMAGPGPRPTSGRTGTVLGCPRALRLCDRERPERLIVQSKAATSVRNEAVSSGVGLLVSQGDQRIYLPGATSGNVPASDGK